MVFNLKSLFQSPGSDLAEGTTPREVRQAGGANAFLAQSAQFITPSAETSRKDRTIPTLRQNEALLYEAEHGATPAVVSPLLFPVGLVAYDGSARLGYDGFMLPTDQGNPNERYFVDPNSITMAATVERWMDVLSRRGTTAAELGVRFAGAILPGKLTLLPETFPEPVVVPPPLTAALEARIEADAGIGAPFGSIIAALRADADYKNIYRKIDFSLTPYGNWRVFSLLASRLGMSFGIGLSFNLRRVVRSTVGDHFFDLPLFDEIGETDSPVVLRAAGGIAPLPQLPGWDSWRRWRNEQAPVDRVIHLYGDPLIGTPDQGQAALAWWFAAFFREVHVSSKIRYDHSYAIDVPPFAVVHVMSEEGLEGPPLS